MSIAVEVYRTCREAVAERGGGRITSVKLAVGELSAVEPELLVTAWEALTVESDDAGAELEIDWRPARQQCEQCGEVAERGEGSWLRLCPRCGLPLAVEGGDELDVLQVAFVTDEEATG